MKGVGEVAEGVFSAVRDVEEPVIVFMFIVDGRHEGSRRGQHVVDEDEDRLFRAELDALSNHVHKLTDGEVSWDEIPEGEKEREWGKGRYATEGNNNGG